MYINTDSKASSIYKRINWYHMIRDCGQLYLELFSINRVSRLLRIIIIIIIIIVFITIIITILFIEGGRFTKNRFGNSVQWTTEWCHKCILALKTKPKLTLLVPTKTKTEAKFHNHTSVSLVYHCIWLILLKEPMNIFLQYCVWS